MDTNRKTMRAGSMGMTPIARLRRASADLAELPEIIEAACGEAGVGLRELARRLDTHPEQVRRWFRGLRTPSVQTLHRIIDAIERP